MTQDLLALYTFAEDSGTTVPDVSNVGAPLNLEISGNTSWIAAGGLAVNSSSSISSPGAASKIIDAVRTSDALSVEVWIKPTNITQDGPARIASISSDQSNRNFTLGQGLWGTNPSDLFDVRLRTAETDTNGQPSLTTSSGSASTQLQHLIFTYGDGQRRIYKDGLLIESGSLNGDLNNWDATYPLVLANEATGDRPWLGELHLVAVYNRDLTAAEVTENYEAGAHPGSGDTTNATATPDIPTPTPDGPTNTPEPPTSTPVPGDETPVLYLSSTSGGTVGGVSFSDEDILAYDTDSATWSLFMDGSNVGLDGSSNRDIDAFHLLDNNSILFSVVADTTLPDVGSVEDSDIIQFVPTALGSSTAGSFSLFFDGSDVGLDESGENIDAFTLVDSGDLIISTLGSWSVGGLSGQDEDLLRFTPTSTGANTSGSWAMFFDGSDAGLADTYHEDIVALWSEPDASALYLSTYGPFAVSGASGDSADVLRCSPSSLGNITACSFDLFWDGSGAGFAEEKIDGLSIRSAGSGSLPPTNTPAAPTATPDSGGGSSSTEMIVYDWNGLVTKAENGFPRHTPPTANGDWTSPTNFAQGTLYFRAEVRSQPVAQEMRVQYCVWQDRNALENCADWTTVFGNPGTVVTWSDKVTDMWMKDGNSIDWSRARYKDGLAIKNSQNKPVSTFQDWNWNGEDPDEWYPIDWRFLVVVVAKGETFSGWGNYD